MNEPGGTFGKTSVADVVRAIRDLAPGFHSVAEVHERYCALTGADPADPDLRQVTTIVSRFGLSQYMRRGAKGWTIDPARLAQRWPSQPWTDD